MFGSASKSKGSGQFMDEGGLMMRGNLDGQGGNRYMTPEKQSLFNSEFKRKMSSPESLFTPLKVPGALKEDNEERSKDNHCCCNST